MPSGNPTDPRHRIVILCGPNLTHRNTCATLIGSGLKIVGICMADQRRSGLPIGYLVRSIRKKGLLPTLSRTCARVAYLAFNAGKDRRAYARLFDARAIEDKLQEWNGDLFRTRSYSDPDCLAWLRARQPDILVVHSAYWVGKPVRDLARTGIVLGGHPGITPDYRGSHAAFWAVYAGKPQDVGCTVFLVDKGVDTGAIVAQERIPIEPGDSFRTLAWKGMIRIAELQAFVLRNYENGIPLPRRVVAPPPGTEFDNPTLLELLRYRLRQAQVR